MHHKSLLVVIFAIGLLSPVAAAEWQGKKSNWNGFVRYDFNVAGKTCFVVEPKDSANGNPWLWRARFPNFHAEIDIELLKHGFHIAHINTAGELGSPKALDEWDKFYELLTTKHDLAKRPALYGVSRGGLFIYRWAARHPDQVACIYADTPVCDFKSWPGGKGNGIGSKGEWAGVLKQYALTEPQALAWRENPIDVLKPLADAKIPLMTIVSETDKVVPPAENTDVLAQRYKALGGEILVTRVKQGTRESHGHHFAMTPEYIHKAVEFILENASLK